MDVVVGARQHPFVGQLIDELDDLRIGGTLYVAYPILKTIEGHETVDALLVSPDVGLTLFDLTETDPNRDEARETLRERQEELYANIYQKLYGVPQLRAGRQSLGFEIRVASVTPTLTEPFYEEDLTIIGLENVREFVLAGEELSESHFKHINAAIERVSTLKPSKKRTEVTRDDSKGAVIQRIEQEIANLDQWQKRAAIETPQGPQRIRGLAGSGKTVVLALKAAYLHTQHPEWNIVLTFHTRSLYQQFKDLVRRFTFETINDEPDWDRLQILHSWGSRAEHGVYSTIASHLDHPVRDFNYGKQKFGYSDAFKGVCRELVDSADDLDELDLFDAVLIDEAQDLPQPFFELSYRVSREPHFVTWAYDELQNLTSQTMPRVEDLFGTTARENPRVTEETLSGETAPRQDIILPVCYRNTPWALTAAHAVGFGVYRPDGLVQFYANPDLWEDIGYDVVEGEIDYGSEVRLQRSTRATPEFFGELLDPDEALQTQVFDSREDQFEWLAEEVANNIEQDELQPTDILIILPNAKKAKKDAGRVIEALGEHDIPAHLAGVTSSRDELYVKNSVALSSIYRAKGNEAPIVYLVDADYGVTPGWGAIQRRNILFTAITRSRAWVRVCGVGEEMAQLQEEVAQVREHDWALDFTIPTRDELERIRRLHREMSEEERETVENVERWLPELERLIQRGELDPEGLPDEVRDILTRLGSMASGNDS